MFHRIDPVSMTAEQNRLLGLTLLRAYFQNRQFVFPDGKQTIEIYDPVQGPVKVDINLAHEIIIRPSAHKPDQLCLEVIGDVLGEGAYAQVCAVLATLIPQSDGSLVAADQSRVSKFIALGSHSKMSDVEDEFNQASLTPDLAVKPPLADTQQNEAVLIGKRMPGVSLLDFLDDVAKGKRTLTTDEALRLCIELIRALERQCHKHHAVHRDIKPGNIMVNTNLRQFPDVYYIDYGLAKDEAYLDARVCGTPLYAAPEAWRGENLYQSGDVYSLGVVLSEVLGASEPNINNYEECLNRTFEGLFSRRVGLKDEEKATLRNLIHQMCVLRPGDRPCLDYVASEIDKIRFARILRHANPAMQNDLQLAHNIATEFRRHINDYYKANPETWNIAVIAQKMELALAKFSDSPETVNEFITTLGIRTFNGLESKAALTCKMEKVAAECIMKRSALQILLKEFDRMITNNEMTDFHPDYLEYLKKTCQNCWRRSALKAESVDEAAKITSKFIKDITKLKFEFEYVNWSISHETKHLPVVRPLNGSKLPTASLGLFARKIEEIFPMPTISLMDHIWTRMKV
jgi:serine/threonine protein kinase